MESYWQTAGIHKDSDKINLIRSYLVSDAGDEYDTRVSELGRFTTYKDLENWLTSHYATPDAVNTYRDRFFGCQQQEGESVDEYFKRFREARNTLDTPLAETYVVYFFIRHLLPRYRTEIRKDKNFATYKGITLDDVNDQLKRVNPNILSRSHPASHANPITTRFRQENHANSPTTNASSTQPNDNREFSNKRRKTQSSAQPSTQPKSNSNPAPLTESTVRFIQAQVHRGGGNQFFDYVQTHPRWQADAKRLNLCYKCGSRQHHALNCNAPEPPPRTEKTGNLNAIINDEDLDLDLDLALDLSSLNSEMQP
jgi:Retrotransposon gag protein